ncbi:MFS transporter [Pigmentibacter ruber]|uniref:MFS transporter n=1 Tax=Pigmentibacter ruber TaxID=2683196 RepID=UPI00131AB7C6|nr:MFS transporter [Pigmentibacter ruber]
MREIKFIFSIFLVFVADHILLFALPLIVFNTTNNISAAGLAYFIEWLPRVLFLPFGGYLTDKFGSKKSLIFIDLVKIVACFIAFIILSTTHYSIAVVIGILGAISSLGTSQTAIAADVLLMKNIELKRYTKVVSYLNMCDQVSMLVGPAIAIFLVTYLPIKYFLLIVPIFYLYNLINTLNQKWRDDTDRLMINKNHESFLISFKNTLLIFKKFPILLFFALQASLINFIISIVEAAGAPLVKILYLKSDAEFGLLNIVAGSFGALSMIITSHFIDEKKVFYFSIIGAFGIILSSYICVFSTGFFSFVTFYGLIIAFTLVNSLFARILRKTLVEVSMLGKITGCLLAINQISVPFSGLFISFLNDIKEIKNLMFYSTNLLILFFLLSYYFSFKYRKLSSNEKDASAKNKISVSA